MKLYGNQSAVSVPKQWVEETRQDWFCAEDASGFGATNFICSLIRRKFGTLFVALKRLPPPPSGQCYTSRYKTQKLLHKHGLDSALVFYTEAELFPLVVLAEHFYPNFTYGQMIRVPWFRNRINRMGKRRMIVLNAYIKSLKDSNCLNSALTQVLNGTIPDGFDYSQIVFE